MSIGVVLEDAETGENLHHTTITSNLVPMMKEADIYDAICEPQTREWTLASQIIPSLTSGLVALILNPVKFDALNHHNGWGKREDLILFVTEYLQACAKHPTAKIAT